MTLHVRPEFSITAGKRNCDLSTVQPKISIQPTGPFCHVGIDTVIAAKQVAGIKPGLADVQHVFGAIAVG